MMGKQEESKMNEVIAIQSPPDFSPMIAMIERVAMSPDVPVDRLTALMDMRERQMNKEAEQSFNQAFANAMADMPTVPKGGLNKHTGQKYSTLDDLINTTRPVLSARGLSLNWQTSASGNEYSVTAIVRHALGHSIQTTLSGPRDNGKQMNQLQGGGSTETYLKRYTGFSILGLSSGDAVEDDGASSGSLLINADQFFELKNLIEEASADEAKFCEFMRVKDLDSLPQKQFASAVSALRAKVAKKKAAA
jgi:hypothetical protein